MIDIYKNLCIVKAVTADGEEIDKVCELASDKLFITCSNEGIDWKIMIENTKESQENFQLVIDKVKNILEEKVYSDNDEELEDCVVRLALSKGKRVVVAESLTGGMIASRIVNVAGSSCVLNEGLVTYTNASKVRRLHVKLSTLQRYGAVSRQTAKEMVEGLLTNDSDFGVATTGCAGPSSDENDTPIGLAYIAIADHKGVDVHEVNFEGDRNQIRKSVTDMALYLLLEKIKNN